MDHDEICARLRMQCGLPLIPVDVRGMARALGLTVVERRWAGRPHAASVVSLRLIILNRNRPETARRFDLAHELGHFVLPETEWHTEAENRFAAALLMPRREFEQAVIRHGANGYCSELFQVSERAVMIRYAELRSWPG